MSEILEIAELGHPVLREVSAPVSNIGDESVSIFIDNLVATCIHSNGVGIAAPQVYEPERIFIISSRPNERYPNAPELGPLAVINPEILEYSRDIEKDWEGCLSIPGIRGLVPRHKSVAVSYTTVKGQIEEMEFTDFVARIFQHELDHLNGTVFLDRLESNKDIITEKEYRKLLESPLKGVKK